MSDLIMTISDDEDEVQQQQHPSPNLCVPNVVCAPRPCPSSTSATRTSAAVDDDSDVELELNTSRKRKAFQFEQEEEDDDEPQFEQQPHYTPYSTASSSATSLSYKIQKQLEKRRLQGHVSESDESSSDEAEIEHEQEQAEEEEIPDTKPRKPSSDKSSRSLFTSSIAPPPNFAYPMHADFSALKLSRPLLRALTDLKFTAPTPVQSAAILPAIAGKDLLVNAVTGSGKTAAFMLPVLERLIYRPKRVALSRVLVLLPTRELAAQCHTMSTALAVHTDVRMALVVGGLSQQEQERALRTKPDIIVATPGRLIDHLRNTQNVHLEDIEILVLDEADRLLECGFSEELREIIKSCPKGRQTLLFSATLNQNVKDLVNLSLNQPLQITISPSESIVDTLLQEVIRIKSARGKDEDRVRESIVLALARKSFKTKCIIFTPSKQICHRLAIIFGLCGLKAAELQGNLTQAQRLDALHYFKTGQVDFLMCTDLAARGLDIQGVETVINYSMPRELRAYIHRVGRTARAGRSGRAVSLVSSETERPQLKEVMKRAKGIQARIMAQEVIDKHRALVTKMESDIRAVFDAEAEEKALRIAEMEANKTANLMKHQDEIMSRPAKTWFQTEAERKAAKDNSVKLFESKSEREKKEKEKQEDLKLKKMSKKELAAEAKKKELNSLRGLNRAKKRRKLMQMEAEKQAAQARSDPSATPVATLDHQMALQRHAAKTAKQARRDQLRESLGMDDERVAKREHNNMIEMKAAKKKMKANNISLPSLHDDESNAPIGSVPSGNMLRFHEKHDHGHGDTRFKTSKADKKKEKDSNKKKEKAEAKAASSSDKPKRVKKVKSGSFKSKSRFKRR